MLDKLNFHQTLRGCKGVLISKETDQRVFVNTLNTPDINKDVNLFNNS